jgi:hypothetical protein
LAKGFPDIDLLRLEALRQPVLLVSSFSNRAV